MRIITKRTRIIQMTEEEIEKFHDLMDQARAGQTVHYAEQQLKDGSHLGVSVLTDAEMRNAEDAERYRRLHGKLPEEQNDFHSLPKRHL